MNLDLNALIEEILPKQKEGKVASYIPALASVDPNQLGIAFYDLKNQQIIQAGDSKTRFAIESISKVIALLWAIKKLGIQEVFTYVGSRQTGFAFNSALNMEITHAKKPLNPFVNVGAIMTTSLIVQDKEINPHPFAEILAFTKEICNDPDLYLDTQIYLSEKETGDLNRSLAYYLKAKNMMIAKVEPSLDTYFKQCSIMVTTKSLANLGAVLANDGIKPWDNQRLISSESATVTKSLMMTAGLYNQSGTYSRLIGVPTKSGVGGGLVSAAPHKFGIGIFSPALNDEGNSVAGLALLQSIVDKLDLNIFK
ncbi:glutaminase A [Lactobacillus sp. PV034]|uniref:glutaminase A n=1 Tax=Lactobacillus sp. PV034 TaxID=2594495 RepID=UPI00223EDF14|nr:glutaminase A [Lactobacillus sp. PV034]QNQ80445.1 glutaminase A [Lactobacillus sp. PV034]